MPAVANIVMEHKLNLSITEVKGELVTPTGAAIAAAIKSADKLPASFKIKKINVSLGEAEVKVVYLNSEVRAYPEYSSVIKLSREHNKSYKEVYDLIVREYHGKEL